MYDSAEPDQTQHSGAFNLDLHCLQRPVQIFRVTMVVCTKAYAAGSLWNWLNRFVLVEV